jgi:hypothetical protein
MRPVQISTGMAAMLSSQARKSTKFCRKNIISALCSSYIPIKQYFIGFVVKVKIRFTQAANKLHKSQKHRM